MENEKPGFFAEVKDLAEQYIQDRLLLVKIEASEKIAETTSRVYILFPLAFIAAIIVLLITFLAGYYLSVWLQAYWAGFGIMILFYIILFFVLIALHRSRMKKAVANKVVESIFK